MSVKPPKNKLSRAKRINEAEKFVLLLRATLNRFKPKQMNIDSMYGMFQYGCKPGKYTVNADLRKSSKNVGKFVDINTLYKQNKKAAMKRICREIVDSDIVPTHDDIHALYSELSKKPEPIDWSKRPHIKRAVRTFEFYPPSRDEILEVFKKCNKRSSPGSDGISYTELQYFDPEGILLEEYSLTLTRNQTGMP